ncbi:MAG: tungstate ABC transporter substrate-binding protein WtpA [Candidatus Hecatellales archaeon]|nr:MAG: tungstate ABC transporter substrate-binding protein WtpA [Candidatus Hecatellales archaeon]
MLKKSTLQTVLAVIVVILVIAGVVSVVQPGQKTLIKVFHAGSLTVPLEEVKEVFERKHPNVEVQLESSGSVEAVRKVTELGKRAEVVAVADWLLLKNLMYPKYASFYVKFATNQVVLAYTDKSRYADEVNSQNWYEILRREDVCFAFSDPNRDPCGYRAVMIIVLAQLYYGEPNFFKELIQANTNIRLEREGGRYVVLAPQNLTPTTGKVKIRPKSVELLALLEEGVVDYAFEYRSVAIQHNLRFIELPPAINLGDPDHEEFYQQVSIRLNAGSRGEKTIVASPIVYGITMPRKAEHKDLAVEFIKLVLSEEGREIFERGGQPPLKVAEGCGELPEALIPLVRKLG